MSTEVMLPSDTVLTSKVFIKGGDLTSLVLTKESIEWFPFPLPSAKTGGSIPLYEVLCVQTIRVGSVQQPALEVTFMPLKQPNNPNDGRRIIKKQLFIFREMDEATEWKNAIVSVMNGEELGVVPAPRRVLFIVNPVGGTKIAVPTFEKNIRPLLDLSGIKYEVILTTHQHHATEIARDLNLSEYDAVVTVSGDGLLHEVVNGLLSRVDWPEAAQFPIGIIPCGSGNGLAKSVQVRDLNAAVLNVVKGHTKPLDIISCFQAGQNVRYGFLGVYWGLIADVDIESERFRWAGAARFPAAFVARVLNLRAYKGKLSYLPANATDDFSGGISKNNSSSASQITPTQSDPNAASGSGVNHFESSNDDASASSSSPASSSASSSSSPSNPPFNSRIPLKYLQTNKDTIPGPGDNWKVIEGEFIGILGLNLAWIDQTTLIAPYAHLHDGYIDLLVIKAPCPKGKLISMFLDIESGKHVNNDIVTYIKCKAFTLDPCNRGIVDVDGEQVDTSEISVECHASLGRLLCPPQLNIPFFDNYSHYHSTRH